MADSPLSKLTPVKPGDSILEVVTSERINAIQEAIGMLFRGENFSPGTGILRTVTPSGVVLRSKPQRGTGATASQGHPFQLLNATDEDGPKLKVSLDSWVMNSISASDKLVVTGLDSAFTIDVDQAVWVQLKFDEAEAIEEVTIEHGDFGASPWTDYPEPVDFDSELENKRQTYAYRLIGYTQAMEYTAQPTGDPASFPTRLKISYGDPEAPSQMQVVQCLKTNLIVCETCYMADTVRVLADYSHVPAPGAPTPP